jgi:hypothetical protein
MRALWLADVLRAGGLAVVEHSGWQTRGFEPWAPQYGIVHATAAPRTQADEDQVRIVRDGHSTLAGPIANCCVDRTGRWHVLASGRCNTALTGWAGPAAGLGNTNLLGIEACNDNRTEPWPAVQYEAYARGWAAICARMGWTAGRLVGHKEHQPGDKSDPTFPMDRFRDLVAALLQEDDVEAREVWVERLAPDATVLRAYPGIRDDGYLAQTWVQYAYRWARRAADRAAELAAGQAAILAAVAGQDVVAAVRSELDRHRAELLAQVRADLVEVLDQRAELGADAVVDELARRLAPAPA